ncbi:hypothetical protein BKA62DRAFT_697926 [Auriculariales sp. MPI-PUGE-AT-0066]|nr:hypothetical protein BKA62DRAFT_697926 [Auriculariales sp. MPI-PUGE-AT-0066]
MQQHQAQPIPIGHGSEGYPMMMAPPSPGRTPQPGGFAASLEQRLQLSLSLSPRLDASLKNLIATSLEQRRLALDAGMLQEDMTRNYTCCGLALMDLHALVDHFEEAHVVVVDPNNGLNFGGGFELADDMDLDGEPQSDRFNQQPTAFDPHTSVLVQRAASADARSAPYPQPLFAHKLQQRYSESECASPTLLFSPSATPSPAPSRPPSPGLSIDSGGTVTMADASFPPRRSSKTSMMAGSDHYSGYDGPVRPKPFRCPKDGCNKSYKQANGLKYHLQHGQCNFAPIDPNADECKPYLCQVGCGKRFKNMSGLRYHYLHSAQHGQTGLALLEAGQLPVPQYPTSS